MLNCTCLWFASLAGGRLLGYWSPLSLRITAECEPFLWVGLTFTSHECWALYDYPAQSNFYRSKWQRLQWFKFVSQKQYFLKINIKIEHTFICSFLYPLGWLLKRKIRISDGEDVETLCTTGGNVQWYSHYENQYAVPQNIKNRVTRWSRNPTSGDILNGKKGLKYICTTMFTAVLFKIDRRWRNPSAFKWMNRWAKYGIHIQ